MLVYKLEKLRVDTLFSVAAAAVDAGMDAEAAPLSGEAAHAVGTLRWQARINMLRRV